MSNIKNNIEEIQKDIKDYSIYPEKVKFIAVTKYVDAEVMNSILDCGVKVFGENKAQVIKEKYEKYLSEFMEQQKQIKEKFKNIQATLYDL